MNTMTDVSGQQQFTAQGCTIHYWIAGSPSRPLVIFTHRAGIDHREWESAERAIAAQYRVVTWDVRGHGRSRPNPLPFTVPLASDDLIALMDYLYAESAILVGHSMGGNIVQEVIRRSPARVQAAVWPCQPRLLTTVVLDGCVAGHLLPIPASVCVIRSSASREFRRTREKLVMCVMLTAHLPVMPQ